ncbi:hypothetical protein K504DRAFT_500904 [Pleomassaria siparia CBS 279.74]|uniref:Uncharacterized protein n=1 Tax=Pleomassaria siparia CBS 279.74 TaxID=1314801 RepID=A0A6G1KDP5_9PLEO|nr:hypothetical protein K504DRAFT_500904 [Pleomassaria siparia CBS 279.74]
MTSQASISTPVPFPHPDANLPPQTSSSPTTNRARTSTNASTTSTSSRIRTASIKLMEASPPPGMWAATGSVASKAPSLAEIRRGSFGSSGWNEQSQRHIAERRASQNEEGGKRRTTPTPDSPSRPSNNRAPSSGLLFPTGVDPFPAVTEEEMNATPTREGALQETVFQAPEYDGADKELKAQPESKKSSELGSKQPQVSQYANGYIPPPKVPWKTSTAIGLKSFSKWVITIPGFLITLYGLNVVAWGGMLFLLLCNASPAMCVPTCNDIQSPRRIWIEIDSQILNGLFCVTGFGLAPWRFRDLYWWGWWRIGGSKRTATGIRRLAGIHRGWFRLPGSDQLPELANATTVSPEDPSVPIPHDKIPDPPPTGIRAPPTKGWKMDFVVWMNVWNTFFQIVLCFYMYHYNRYLRPSWATGCFVALGCIVAGVAGIMMYHEGKNVKRVEGVPVPKEMENRTDVESGPATSVPDGTAKS